MSQLKISPNLFLEVQELKKLMYFLSEDGYKPFLKHLTKSFGIAQNKNNTYFKVSRKIGSEDTVVINPGIAFNQNLEKIYLGEDTELTIPNTGENQWLVISYAHTNNEQGTVDVSAQGVLNGNKTQFISVLRGQPNFPTKIRFSNSNFNTGEYEVVNISSDTVATIVGDFVAEKGLKYQVIGTFTPGFQPDDENKAIYEYDSCKIEIIESEDRPTLSDGQYIIAKVFYVDGTIGVTDERIRNLFNYEQKIDEDINLNTLQSDSFVALRQTTMRGSNLLDVQFEWGYTVSRFEIVNTAEQNIFNIITGSSKYISSNQIPDGIFTGWLLINRKNMVSVVIDNNISNKLYITTYNPLIVTNEGDDEFVIVPNCRDIEVEVKLNAIKKNAVTETYSTKAITDVSSIQTTALSGTVISSSDKVLGVINPNFDLTKNELNTLISAGAIQVIQTNKTLEEIKEIYGESFVESENLKYDASNNVLVGTVDKNLISDELVDLLDVAEYGDTKFFFRFSIENVASRFTLPIEYGQTLVSLRYRIISSTETTKFQGFANSQFTNIKGDAETLGESSFIVIVNKPEEVQRNYS